MLLEEQAAYRILLRIAQYYEGGDPTYIAESTKEFLKTAVKKRKRFDYVNPQCGVANSKVAGLAQDVT